jgi:hypothetical protein
MRTLLETGFILLALACALVSLGAINRAHRGLPSRGRVFVFTGAGMALWLTLTAVAAIAGWLTPTPDKPPPNLLILAIAAVMVLFITLGPIGKALIQRFPPSAFIAFQVFRVPVELALWGLAELRLGPELLTFEGRNFDIITGLTAPVIAWLVARKPSRALIIGWNLIGLALLLNVLAHAVLAMPGPMQRIHVSPGTEVVTTFPYIWLPALLVPLALALHVLSLRQAFAKGAE